MQIDIGCGSRKQPGYLGVDSVRCPGVDVVADLDAGLPFGDSTVSAVYASHVLEHLQNPVAMLEEIHRILRPGGQVFIRVPHFTWNVAYNPFHIRFWSYVSFDVFDPNTEAGRDFGYMTAARFRIDRREIRGVLSKKLPHTWPFALLARVAPALYERSFAFLAPAGEVDADMSCIKDGPPATGNAP